MSNLLYAKHIMNGQNPLVMCRPVAIANANYPIRSLIGTCHIEQYNSTMSAPAVQRYYLPLDSEGFQLKQSWVCRIGWNLLARMSCLCAPRNIYLEHVAGARP
jgi:hypothetical protein